MSRRRESDTGIYLSNLEFAVNLVTVSMNVTTLAQDIFEDNKAFFINTVKKKMM